MAVGKATLPAFAAIKGVRLASAYAGIKNNQKNDVSLFEITPEATVAGVFTKNAFSAAPVKICQQHLAQGEAIRYLLVNTGNANAGTGELGFVYADKTLSALAEKTGVKKQQILPFSTGVIGEHLPYEKIIASFDQALANLSEQQWSSVASAIMTTDTRPKGFSKSFTIAGKTLNISGISKGSGMIHPNMATMLAFVACDAAIESSVLNTLIQQATKLSFNRITVDGDTSTNDSAILIATGQGQVNASDLNAAQLAELQQAINECFIELAQLIIKDGEGASKFVAITVSGGKTEVECEKVAFTVAHSPLVKTALSASDANWGRILAAVGRSGLEALEVDKVRLEINGVLIAEQGGRAASYSEEAGSQALAKEEIAIAIDLGRGDYQASVWTCDLSHEYVSINADYRS